MTYSGTNPTAKQSKELLANALAQLLSTKKFTQISIKEICEEAQVSRQTFYNLFDSKDDILRYYLEATMKTMFAPLWQKRDQSPDHLINVTIRYVETNRFFLRLLVENSLQSMFLQAIQSGITELTKNEPTDYSEFRKAFIAGGLTQAIIQWIYEPQNVKSTEFSEMLSEMIENFLGVVACTICFWFFPNTLTVILWFAVCLVEIPGHLVTGLKTKHALEAKGKIKKTIYNPGLVSDMLGFLPMAIVMLYKLVRSGTTWIQWIGGIILSVVMMLLCIQIPDKVFMNKNTRPFSRQLSTKITIPT